MSESSSAAPSSSPSAQQGFFKDIIFWKRKNLSFLTLITSTITWILLEAYQFNFITVVSWACMFTIVALFLWDNLCVLLGKERGSLSKWEVSEESTEAVANWVRETVEDGVQWMFKVSGEKEWYVFAGNVVLLFIASKIASFFDLMSLVYTGTLVGMTVPVMYIKYEERLKHYAEGLKWRWRRMCETVDDRVVRKVKSKFATQLKKDKKVE